MQHFKVYFYFIFNRFISKKELETVGSVQYLLKCDLEYFNNLKSTVPFSSACQLTTGKS